MNDKIEDREPGAEDRRPVRRYGRVWAGLFLLLVGGVLLLDQMGFPFPDWLFSWHVLLIVVGLFLGFRHNFRGGAWIIMIMVGAFYLVQDYYPELPVHRFIWPAVLIGVGLLFILRPHHKPFGQQWRDRCGDRRERDRWHHYSPVNDPGAYSSSDFIDSTAIFSGVHKKIVTKTFKGGDITNIMGGTELDLSQADFTGVVILDVTQIMGGSKIIVPSHWEVRSEVTALFAGFEDKRQQTTLSNPDKLLLLKGTSIFGGIEIRNF
jgi:predicted membrane protein